MIKARLRRFTGLLAAALVAVVFLTMPGAALAAGVAVPGGSLATAISENPGVTEFEITGTVSGCDIPSGYTITVASGGVLDMTGRTNKGTLAVVGKVTGNFYNDGTLSGSGNCTGTVYVKKSAASGASEVIFTNNQREAANYAAAGILWVPSGWEIAYLVIGSYLCTPSGGRLQYSITYKYNNASQSAMTLDTKKYPDTYCVMVTDQTIPAPPDTEIDYVFAGWYCQALGVTEANLQKTLTIPAGISGNLTLYSYWTESEGHNANMANPSGGMSAGGGMGSFGSMGGGGGRTGQSSAANSLLTQTEEKTETTPVTNLLTGTQNGVRVRTAKSTSKHSFTSPTGDVEARANQRQTSQFPWQWLGAGLGGALALTALIWTLRRRLAQRDAATLEKLNIHD